MAKVDVKTDIVEQDETVETVGVSYALAPQTGWRTRVRDYTALIGEENQAKLDELRDVVYGMALDGASERYIADYFGFDVKLVRIQLGPVIKMAQAELALAIRKSNVIAALDPKANPITRIWAAKQHAGQTDVTAVEIGDGEGGFGGLIITKVQANRDQTTGKTIGEAYATVVQEPQSE